MQAGKGDKELRPRATREGQSERPVTGFGLVICVFEHDCVGFLVILSLVFFDMFFILIEKPILDLFSRILFPIFIISPGWMEGIGSPSTRDGVLIVKGVCCDLCFGVREDGCIPLLRVR